jgi:hypothetical protein
MIAHTHMDTYAGTQVIFDIDVYGLLQGFVFLMHFNKMRIVIGMKHASIKLKKCHLFVAADEKVLLAIFCFWV